MGILSSPNFRFPATDNPAQLKKACATYRAFGLWEAALIKALAEDDFNLAKWFQENPGIPPVGGFA